MEKFIEKMETLLQRKEWLFKNVLVALTLVGLFFFFCSPRYWSCLHSEIVSVYVTSGAWILFAAWILWLMVLLIDEQNAELRQLDWDLDSFLKQRGNRPFVRHDFAKFKYGEKIPSSSSRYKNLRSTLENALDDWRIEICENIQNTGNKIVYRKKLISKEKGINKKD